MTVEHPDLVNQSGRETMGVGERVDLLRADLAQPPFAGIDESTAAISRAIHDVKLTIGLIRGTIDLYDRAIARGESDARLRKGANRVLSDVECLVLAWRRGGHVEYDRVRREQRRIQT